MGKRDKKPKLRAVPPSDDEKAIPGKQTQVLDEPDDADTIIVRFNRFDIEGPWCLSKITPADHVKVLQFVESVEKQRMGDAFNGGYPGKDYEVKKLPTKESKARLAELDLDDQTKISRFQVSGERRLYGFRRGRYFYALWWDPKHEIWPSTR